MELHRARSGALILLAVIVLAGVAAGCTRGGEDSSDSAEDINMEIQIRPDPPEVGPAIVEVVLTDEDGNPIDDAELEIEGNMSHAGMEPVNVDATGGQDGHYVSDGFEFTMGGDWLITVSGTLADGREIERTFDLAGVTS